MNKQIGIIFEWEFNTPGDICPEGYEKEFNLFREEFKACFHTVNSNFYVLKNKEVNIVLTITAFVSIIKKYSRLFSKINIIRAEVAEVLPLGDMTQLIGK